VEQAEIHPAHLERYARISRRHHGDAHPGAQLSGVSDEDLIVPTEYGRAMTERREHPQQVRLDVVHEDVDSGDSDLAAVDMARNGESDDVVINPEVVDIGARQGPSRGIEA